ncbi:MAG: hypothetical protein IIC60_05865 [Proteobacteria bacterium]|nr:hypothetical protein [Pseudomonadota bacterium]
MEEYALTIAIPFVSFVLINLIAVSRASMPFDRLMRSAAETRSLSHDQKLILNSTHCYLTYGLYSLIIVTTVLIHMLTMWLEDGSFDFPADPDSWSLLVNRGSLFLLVVIIQGNVFDQYISKLKNSFSIKEEKGAKRIGLFKRLSWMLATLVLFLGSSIPIFSTMRFDRFVDESLPSITINLDESKNLARDIPRLVALLENERGQFIDAHQEYVEMIAYLNQQLELADFSEDSAEDNYAQIYLKHCVSYLMAEPSGEWSGAVVIAEK